MPLTAESIRLQEDARRELNWKRWGPYLSERQWGTVREDYSATGEVWEAFTHDMARSRTYRWGEDGLLGITDRECRLCFGLALWNGRDPILKERLFGLNGHEGNHSEDVKECYYYLDSTPTHSYMKALYKYPQTEFPYGDLVAENRRRTRADPEYELVDTNVFDEDRYFDVFVEYAKGSPNDILIRITATNHGPAEAPLAILPTLWFRNYWSWGRSDDPTPRIVAEGARTLVAEHPGLGVYRLQIARNGFGLHRAPPEMIFTENESNRRRLWGVENHSPYVKDAFHRYVVNRDVDAVNPRRVGTKAAFVYKSLLAPGETVLIELRLSSDEEAPVDSFGEEFDATFSLREQEANEFYQRLIMGSSVEQARVARQAYAGLLWTKQYYNYVVREWLEGDPATPPPPAERWKGRNSDWQHVYNRDIISMPDKWEYPWYAAWDLAFQMIPFARVDQQFAKEQLILLLREWYMHPNGQLPAYEFAFSDVNPPVHAWAAWRVYKMTGPKGARDHAFLERVFHKLLINFSWWVNRKDPDGNHLFSGGFLGLDNIGVFDRNKPMPNGQYLEQADGTAWMAFYCTTMLSISLELAMADHAYEDMASTFFEHFVSIADAMNSLGGAGLWDDQDGFYYDQLCIEGQKTPMRIRSIVGLVPLLACECIDQETIDKLPGFKKRMQWFLNNRHDLAAHISYMREREDSRHSRRLLAMPARHRLVRMLRYVLDENEFLSPYGIRSLSKAHSEHPFTLRVGDDVYTVRYSPGESDTYIFGGNSNWRGPIWFPINYLVIEALERYHHFYGDSLTVEYPTGSGRMATLGAIALELSTRLTKLFLPDERGRRPAHGNDPRYARSPHWRDLVLFYEHFHGDTGRGLGASHQTGWTALVTRCLEKSTQRVNVSRPSEQMEAVGD
jgi:Mannosylglycerate hydrolase MGH1-like glycoside hydrolase domain/Glycosyl hydrolase family 63 C-terminal domain